MSEDHFPLGDFFASGQVHMARPGIPVVDKIILFPVPAPGRRDPCTDMDLHLFSFLPPQKKLVRNENKIIGHGNQTFLVVFSFSNNRKRNIIQRIWILIPANRFFTTGWSVQCPCQLLQ